MDRDDRVVDGVVTPITRAQEPKQPNPLPLAIISVQQQAKRSLTEMLETCFSASDAQFVMLSDKSKRPADQEGYFYAMRELYLKRKPLADAFFNEFDHHFLALADGHDQGPNTEATSANVHAAIEVPSIAETDWQFMIERATSFHQIQITELAQRFATALETNELFQPLPLSPSKLYEFFVTACLTHELPKRVINVTLKMFERTVINEMGTLYQQLNARFEEMGIRLKVLELVPMTESITGIDDDNSRTSNTLNKIFGAQVLHQESPLTQESLRKKSALHSEMSKLNNNQPEETTGTHRRDQIIARTLATLGERHGLATPLIPLINQLQKPLAHIAQYDQGFFNSRDNAARRLVNALSTAALAFGKSEIDEIESDPLFLEIKRVIGRLHDRAYTDSKAISALADEFEQFIVQERRDLELFEKRLLTVVQGKQQATISQQRVRNAIAEITQGFELQPDVQALVDNAWYQVMFVTALKHGIDSAEWDEVSQTLTDLVLGTQPYINQAERARGLATLEDLKLRVRMGLESISFDQAETNHIVEQLEKSIRSLLREEESNLTTIIAKSTSVKTSIKKISHVQADILDQEMIARAKSLVQGSWFDMKFDDQTEVRCRLAAIIGNHETYLFVGRSGVAIAEKSLDEVVEALSHEQLRPLRSHKIFDVALRQVISGMKQALESA